jgi:capsid protein
LIAPAKESRFEFTEKAARENFTIRAGYDAAESTNRRKAPKAVLKSEDDVADNSTRRRLNATARDMRRNISIARWMINKHLDFVVSHNFKARTGDKDFDKDLETWLKYVSHKKRFDIRQMHPRRRFMRILEAGRTVGGDTFGMKVRGGFLQGIEGDRVRDPGRKRTKKEKAKELQINAQNNIGKIVKGKNGRSN